MVPQPSRTLDHQRKEELILQKQIRQSTAKIKKNLPTLIGRHTEQLMKLYLTVTSFSSTTEASPDFNSKKHQLPYLPYLPPSVQVYMFHISKCRWQHIVIKACRLGA